MSKRTLSVTLGLALTAGLASVATATGAHAAGQTCTIPANDLTITTAASNGTDTVKAWDDVKVSYTLKNLDGLAAGSCITFSAPKELTEIPAGTIDLKAPDGSLIGTQAIADGVVTVTLTTDYAKTHQNVQVWGSYTARVTDQIVVNGTQPLVFTVNGTVTTTQDVKTGTCVDCSVMPVGYAQKYGSAQNGKGTVYVNVPVVADQYTTVTIKDTLTSPGQAFAGTPTADAYTSRNPWGGFENVQGRTVTANADGTWSVVTTRPNEALRISIPMTFEGQGPWTDTATVVVNGKEYSASALVKSYSANGGGDGTTPAPVVTPTPTPVVTPTPKPTPTPVVTPPAPKPPVDVPVKPAGTPEAPKPPTKPVVKTRAYTAQVDTYGWKNSAWFGQKIADLDNDGILKYREDGFVWMTKAGKKYTSSKVAFVTFTAPVNATKAQLVAAYNAKAPAALRITSQTGLGKVTAKTGSVTDVWVLGAGATVKAPWGASHTVNQAFLGRH